MDDKDKKNIEDLAQNSDLALEQGQRVIESIDGLEPALEIIAINTQPKEVQKVKLVAGEEDEDDTEEIGKSLWKMLKGPKGPSGSVKLELPDGDIIEKQEGTIFVKGVKGEKGDKGDTGEAGYTPKRGEDYFTPDEVEEMAQEIQSKLVLPKDGKDGKNGKNGKDGKDGSPDTPEEIKTKLESLPEGKGLDYEKLSNKPELPTLEKIEQVVNNLSNSAKTYNLPELADVLISATPSNGQVLAYDTSDGMWKPTTSGGGGITDGDKGDITVSSSGSVWTIDNSSVTLAKMADVATATVFYRKTAGTGVPEVQTLATLKTDLGLTGTNSGDQTSIVGITGTLAEFNAALTGADFATGGGTVTGSSSGTNTGDQTSIVGISGTKAQFDTACSDGNFLYVGDVTQYTDEMAQDAVGGALTDSSTIDFTYDDGAGTITAIVKDNSIDGTKIALGSDAQGDIMYYDGTNYVRLPKGAAGQSLRMNSGATAPEWTDRYYVLVVSSAQNNPADSTNTYFGTPVQATGTDSDESQMQIPISGTVVAVYQKVNVGTTLGSTEDVAWNFRLNDTTDTALTSMDYDVQVRKTSTTGLSIAVSAGDAFNIKTVNPAWVTNPTAVRLSAEIVIKY